MPTELQTAAGDRGRTSLRTVAFVDVSEMSCGSLIQVFCLYKHCTAELLLTTSRHHDVEKHCQCNVHIRFIRSLCPLRHNSYRQYKGRKCGDGNADLVEVEDAIQLLGCLGTLWATCSTHPTSRLISSVAGFSKQKNRFCCEVKGHARLSLG